MSYIDNDNIGTFDSLEELWAAHPGGGHEGDWCTVDGVIYHWNIYTRAWESTEGNVSTNARENVWFEGDVTINHNLTVGGSLRAKRIKQPCMGLFSTEESLTSHWPDPVVGMWAIVGTAPPFIIWRCDEDGVWTNTGEETEGFDGLELVEIEEAISGLQLDLDSKIDKTDIADNLTTDSPTKVLSARQGKILNEKKLDYYDTSWIYSASQRTEANFNALKAASLAQKFVVANGDVCISDAETFENKVVLSNFREGGYNHIEVSLREGAVGVSFRFIVYAESADVVSLGERVTTAEGDITTLGGRVTSVETWQTQAGNATSIPHYHSANWLEDEEGSYSADHPERRQKVRYTSMISAINDNRLIKLYNVTASGLNVNNGVISAVFMTTNANGKSQTVRYYVRYTSGDDYCTVEKKEISMPYYDATWATMIGGSLEQLEEFINVINSTPKALIVAGNQPVVWAARRTPYMVQFAVMRDSGLRIYATEYDSDAGEAYPTYEDKSFQELLVSGTNIKTINNQSLLGSGNITIQGGGGTGVQSYSNYSEMIADTSQGTGTIGFVEDEEQFYLYDSVGEEWHRASDETLMVAISYDSQFDVYTSDTTFNKITEAIEDGKHIIAMYDSRAYELNEAGDVYLGFERVERDATYKRIRISNANAVTYSSGNILTSGTNIKTVNNTSLVGSGNVSTETPVVEVNGATVTQTLSPNTFYKFTGAITSLTLTLGSEVSGITNIFAFSFTAGQDAPTITLPQSVTIADAPDIHSGDYVEFSIMDNKAIAKVWAV